MASMRRILSAGVLLLLASAAAAEERLVGEHGDPARLVLEGVEGFSHDEIRTALGGDFDVLLAAYPDSPIAEYLRAIERKLTLGYRNCGYPHAKVAVRYDGAGDRVVVSVAEGRRYHCGGVKVVAGENVSEAEILAALVQTPKPLEETASDAARKEKPAPEDPKPSDTRVWQPGKPASFVESTWSQYNAGIGAGLAAQGYFFATYRAEVRPGDFNGEATLWVFVDDPGSRATVGEIRVEGAKRHAADQIRKCLNVRPGVPFDGRLKAELERALEESGRFLSSRVWIEVPFGDGTPADLHIEVRELPCGSLLDEPLTEREQIALRAARWLTEWHTGQEDFVLSSTGWAAKESGETADLRVVLSPERGVLANFEIRGIDAEVRLGYAILLREGRFLLESRHRGVLLDFNLPDGFAFHVPLTLSAGEKPNGEASRTMFFGAYTNSAAAKRGEPPVRVGVTMTPAGAIAHANDPELDYTVRDGVLTATNEETNLAIDAATGRLLWFDLRHAETGARTSARMVPGEFSKQSREMEERVAKLPKAVDSKTLLTGVCRFAVEEADHLLGFYGAEGGRARCSLVRKLLANGMLAPIDRALAAEAAGPSKADGFSIPPEGPKAPANPQQGMFEWAARALLPIHSQLFPVGSAQWTAGRELAFLVSGRGRHTGRELTKVLNSTETGPLSDLYVASLFSLVEPNWGQLFAGKGLTKPRVEDFRRDYRLVLRFDNILGELVLSTADAVRRLEDDDIRLLADTLDLTGPPERREALARVLLRLKEAPEKPVREVVPLALDELWEQGLRTAVEQALRSLAKIPEQPTEVPQQAQEDGAYNLNLKIQ